MKKHALLSTIALTLCTVFLLTGCGILPSFIAGNKPNSPTTEQDDDRRVIPYASMEYVRPDVDAIKARLAELTEEIKTAESFEELLRLDDEASELGEHFSTMSTLAMLKTYHNATDTFFEEEYRYCEDRGVELGNFGNDLNRAIIESPYADEYREYYGDYVFESIENSLLLNSVEVEPLKQRRNQLNIDYNNALATLTLKRDGKEYTTEDIYGLYNPNDSSSIDVYFDYLMAYYSENAEQFAGYYIEMIALDKEIAAKLGFETPEEMYYLTYSRDYTPADALDYCQNAKDIFVPLAQQVYAYETYLIEMDLDKTMDTMPKALKKIDPTLVDTWEQMVEYGLYDFAPLPNKQSGIAFSTYLPEYDTPFLYSYWENEFYDATTLMHEFGHFNDNWQHYDEAIVDNLDIAETYSQGLELLMNAQFRSFTEYYEPAQEAHLKNFMNPLTYQAMLEEFQQELYAMETLDSDNIAKLYADMQIEYGYEDSVFDDGNGRDYSWFQITHLFDAPFYTISYWTSACVALQIWAISRDDYSAAVEIYNNLLTANQNQPFNQLVTSVGLQSPSYVETLQDIAESFVDFYELSPISYGAAA
ncbi:hypothetical protein LJC61_03680 [Ruminococcaceae bacterium OttesenSCG-928-A16]|nr:hypothetical protein [Ruminococcaceae bacterium OttesenSCG-928-A16]